MTKTAKIALAAAVPILLLAGCSDFLKGPGLSTNPNLPTTATPDQLWVGVEVAVMAQYENYPLMLFMTWAQGIAGSNRQWQTYGSYNGGTDNLAADGAWNQTYGPGGLRDIKQIQDALTTNGAIHWRGETRVLEALYMGTAADIWGDVPFSTAGSAQPTFDTQATVYAHVLALLDSAITDLASSDTKLPISDFFYNNNAAQWTQLAHTLKARFLMHNARNVNDTTYNAATLASVITEATAGINSAANDFKPSHTSTPGEQNLFYSFQFSRAGDVEPAATHINLTKQAGEAAMLPTYYVPAIGVTNYYGAQAGAIGDPIDGIAADSVSTFAVANEPAAEYPFASYAENQMLLAEAQYRTGAGATAVATLNAYRATVGAAPLAPAADWHRLEAILREKFIHEFYNMEPWNDYLRTCYPNTPQPVGVNPSQPYVPARLPVGYTEQSANPNVPAQPGGNPPNANMATPAAKRKTIDGVTACIGQVSQP